MSKFREDLEVLINRNSKERGSDTPDFILADYLADCLDAFDKAITRRKEWYGKLAHHNDEVSVKLINKKSK